MADSGDDGYSLESDSGDLRDERDLDDMSEELSRDEDDRYASLDIDAMQLDYASDSEGDMEGLGWPRHGPFLTRVLVRNDAQECVPPADVNSYKLSSTDKPVNRWTELFHAALSGKADDLHQILAEGGEVLARADSFYPTTREFPRMFEGDEEQELRLGILHHICDPRQRTILTYAAMSGHLDTVKEIIPPNLRNCDTLTKRLAVSGLLRRCDVFGRSVFHYAAHHGLTEIFFYLFDAFETACGWSEFSLASDRQSFAVTPLSELSFPATATRESVLRHESRDLAPTVLCQAALQGHLELVMKLLAFGATDISYREEPSSAVSDVDLVAVAGQAAAQPCTTEESDSAAAADLHVSRSPNRATLLLPPEADAVRDTALICAASGGHTLVVQALLTSGKCDIEARGQFGETAIHRAAACKGGRDAMKLLLDAGANADAVAEPPEGWSDEERWKLTMYWGGTAILRAAHVGDVERVNMLLAKNVKVDVADCDLDTALHAAASALNMDVIKRLTTVVDRKMISELLARVNNRGRCPLHCAVAGAASMSPGLHRSERMRTCVDVMEHLVAKHKELGVTIDVQDVDGATPLFEAARNGLEAIVRILIGGGATPHIPVASGDTPLTCAASEASVGILRQLVEAGADVKYAHPRSKETPLHFALLARKGEADVVAACKILIQAGAEVSAVDGEGRSPIGCAAEMKKQELLMLLLKSGAHLDWMSAAGSDVFQCLYGGQDQQGRAYHIREAQQSAELCQKAVNLCQDNDLAFVGSKINRALYENFSRIACSVLAAHKDRVDDSGNNLLMLATLRGWNYVVKEMVSMDGINIEQRNTKGDTAMMLACKEGAWESFLDLYGAGAMPPQSANAELMVAASLHQWQRIEQVLQRLVDEQRGSPPRHVRTDRADTPVPEGPDTSVSSSAIDMPHHMMHMSPAVQAVSSMHAWPGISKEAVPDATAPPLKRRRQSSAMHISAIDTGLDRGADSPRAPQTDATDHVPACESNFTWLIAQLMGTREPDSLRCGQPAVSMRDRILALLRPMMNFQEKVTYFQEEQDRMLEYELDHMGDDETLHIEVHRGPDMLVEMVEQISKADDEMLHRELTVSFIGEDGEDGGGLLREFCAELAAVVRDPASALFQQVPEDSGLYQPSEKAHVQSDTMDVVLMYRSLGVVVAKAVAARACFPLRFTQSFLKQMLDETLDLDDLKTVDPVYHRGLMDILGSPLESIGMDGLNFTTETSFFGCISTVDLIPRGSTIMVTDDNKEEYVLLLARHKMTECIKPYIKAFCEGFWACISLDSLRIFSPDQLGLLISGRQEINIRDMMAHIKYEGGYSGVEDTCIRWFWEIVKELDQTKVAKLLAFMTGSSVVPAIGFKGLRPQLAIVKANEERLPSSHTCVNQLVLYDYKDKERLKNHLTEALEQPSSFQFR